MTANSTVLDRAGRDVEPFPDHHNDLAATLKFAWASVGRGGARQALGFSYAGAGHAVAGRAAGAGAGAARG